MNKIERVIDNLQDVIVQLEEVRVNLTKLGLDKRTPETLSRQYNKAKNLRTSIEANYNTLIDLSQDTADEFLPKYLAAKKIFSQINEFIGKHHPELLKDDKGVIETTKETIHPEKRQAPEAPSGKDLNVNAAIPTKTPMVINPTEQKTEHTKSNTLQREEEDPIENGYQFETPQLQQNYQTLENHTFVEGVGYVLNNPERAYNTKLPQRSQPSQTTEALLHAIAKLTIERENNLQATGSRTEHIGVKIPEIHINEFSGNITKYREFKEQFDSLVRRSHTSSIDRFALLKSKLSGKALEAISDLDLTGDNYVVAWALLDRTFDNPRHLAKVELEALLALPQRPTIPGNADSIITYMHYTKGRISNLKKIEVNGEQILAFLILRGLDPVTRGRLEDVITTKNRFPTLEQIEDFMFSEYQHHLTQDNVHKAMQPIQKIPGAKGSWIPNTRVHATVQPQQTKKCFICRDQHYVTDCPQFLSSQNRETLLRDYKICIFCAMHRFDYRSPCRSKQFLKCEICQGPHIMAMHPQPVSIQTEIPATSSAYLCQNESETSSNVLLPTAIATLLIDNEDVPIRCLLDQSSQANYITEDLVQKLRLPKKRTLVKVIGVGGEIGTVRSIASIKLKLDHPELPFVNIKALVVKRVTGSLPSTPSHIAWKSSFDKPLADPQFNKPAHIPLLLGGPVYSTVLRPGLEKKDGLLLQNTYLGGWIVSGDPGSNTGNKTSVFTTLSEYEANLVDFWDMPARRENIDEDDDLYCEKLFIEKHCRTKDGRYVVPIPWKDNAPALGNSFRMAVKFFMGQERRWEKDEIHKEMSNDFMADYLTSNHMSPVPVEQQRNETGKAYYIPYISIIRKDAITTKLRNVFNASAPSSNGVCLNQLIHPGPKLQSHIFDIVHQSRQYEFIFTSDIQQMFRQFLIPESDRCKFRIIWRPNKKEPLGEYTLNTVTYGVDCAPWQAIRTVRQIAEDNAPDLETIDIIKNSIYMDDLIHGADSITKCQDQIAKITTTLEAGKLSLTKWASNKPEVLNNVEDSRKLCAYKQISDPTMKILGILYNPVEDVFSFKNTNKDNIKYTKRGLLSAAASLYDPMGWILPVIMLLRIWIQDLWVLKYDWDDLVDEKIQQKFGKVFGTVSKLNNIKIPRWIGGVKSTPIQLIGFCDASGDGYAAVVYSRVKIGETKEQKSTYNICLLAARGRVTPLKTKANKESKLCTIPKMELEGILLLTELFTQVSHKLNSPYITMTGYTDSMVALAWVRNNKEIDSKFVKSRVRKIRKVINPRELHYVQSSENPADPASRGLAPTQLIDCTLWLRGPSWLINDQLPLTPFKEIEVTISNATTNEVMEESFIERFSCFKRLLRVIAYCLRWTCKIKNETRPTGPVTAEEISKAKVKIIRYQQQRAFRVEISQFNKSRLFPKKSWLACLTPFIDSDGLLRVGGRISLANIPESQRHPIILTKCHLVDLIVQQLQQQFWKRFHQEYLQHLQKRNKWKFATQNLGIGDVVLLQEASVMPSDWKMGRIIECYPDEKGNVRRVDVKTTKREVVHRATNQLVAIFPDDTEEEPALRRSNRVQNRTTTLLTRVILFWLSLTYPATSAFDIQPLTPGINIQRLGNASIKLFNLEFSVETSLNITADLHAIDTLLQDFKLFCNQYDNNKYSQLNQHCQAVEQALTLEAERVKEGIIASYPKRRSKRGAIPMVIKGLVKYAPQVLMTAGIAYQAVENNNLEQQITQLKNKISKVSYLMTNITDLEFKAVDTQLDELIEQQQQLRVQEQINTYSASIQLLISTIQTHHQNIENIRPSTELKEHVTRLNNGLSFCMLPPVSDVSILFTFNKIAKFIRQDMVIVTFTIPIVKPKIFIEFVFINVPTIDSHAILLGNGSPVQQIMISSDNATFFEPSQAIALGNGIYEDVKEKQLNECWKEVLKVPTHNSLLANCNSTTANTDYNIIHLIKDDLAVIFRSKDNDVNLLCNSSLIPVIAKVNVVRFPGCTISSNSSQVVSPMEDVVKITTNNATTITDNLSPPRLLIQKRLPTDPRIALLKAEISDELEDGNRISMDHQYWYLGGALCSILLLFAIILTIAIQKTLCKTRTMDANISYLSKEDKIPGSWARTLTTNNDPVSIIISEAN